MKRATMFLLACYAFAVPWEYSLDLGEPFGNIARLVGLLLLLALLLRAGLRQGIRRPGALQWLVLALYLYFVASGLWTVDGEATAEKIRAYFQVMMVIWLAWEAVETPEDLRLMARALVAGCSVLALLTIQSFTNAEAMAAEQIRFVAEGQDPNDVARFLDLGLPIAALLCATEPGRWARWIAAGYLPIGLTAVLLTASRGGFSAAVLASLGAGALLVRWRPRAALGGCVSFAAGGAALWLFIPSETLERLATIPEQVGTGDLNDRLSLWGAGWHAFTQAPWLGYGAGNFSLASGLSPGDTAHNTLIAVLVMGGLLAATILVAIGIAVTNAAIQTRGLFRIAALTTVAVWVTTSMVGSVEENRMTWLIFAFLAISGRMSAELPQTMESAWPLHGRIPEKAGWPSTTVVPARSIAASTE